MAMPKQRPGTSRQDYSTPAIFMAAVQVRLGIESFTYDLAADHTNTKAPQFFSKEENALAADRSWAAAIGSGWGWLNPPYKHIDPWARKCAASGAKIAFLVPASVGADWFLRHVWKNTNAGVLFLNGRLAFIEGRPDELYPKDCMLVLFGSDFHGCDVWNWRRTVTKRSQ